jgi:hypothetical protein
VKSLRVDCRVRGHTTVGRAYDLTREGCLVDSGNGATGAGDRVALRFPSGVRLNGRVTLLHGRIARVEFEQPLHAAVLAHLAESDAADTAPFHRDYTLSRRLAGAARRLG